MTGDAHHKELREIAQDEDAPRRVRAVAEQAERCLASGQALPRVYVEVLTQYLQRRQKQDCFGR